MKNLVPAIILFLWVNTQAQSFSDPNFTAISIGSGWNQPVGAAFSSNGQRLFVWERAGKLFVCNRDGSGNYIKQATPVADISEEVANWDAHGMLGFATDPNFETNGLIYLMYAVDRHHLLYFGTPTYSPATTITGQATIGRVTRYQTSTSGGNLVINPATRSILIGETKSTGMAILHHSHGVGTLAFASDGTLLVSMGDAASYEGNDAGSFSGTFYQQALTDGIIRSAENVGAFRAQMLNSHNGKLLRIDPQTGNGVPSNPFYSAAEPRSAKSRVWALGLRNSFRIHVKPGTGSTDPAAGDIGEIYLGDVGFASWEELNIVTAPGSNFGWPIYEGNEYTIPLSGAGGITYKDLNVQNLDEPNPLHGSGGCNQPYFYFNQLIKQATVDENKTIYNPCNGSQPIGTGNRYYHKRPALEWSHAHPWARVGIFNGSTPAVAMIGSPESQVIGTPFSGQCSVGGIYYTGDNFPAQFKNTFFQGDFVGPNSGGGAWIRSVSIDYTDVVTRVQDFATGMNELVCITQNPIDGTLVTVEMASTTGVKKIQYGGNQPPVSRPTASVKYGPSPLTVNFNGSNSFDPSPGGSIISYSWNFGGGSPSTSTVANPGNIVFTESSGNPRKFVVKLTVTDNGGATHTDSVIISVNNTPPVVNITSPIKNSHYTPGPDTLYSCIATVSDGQHSGSQLKYEWQTILRHNSHEHRDAINNAISPSTLIQRVGFVGDDVYYWLIELTVTDAAGLSTKDSSKIFPDRSTGGDVTPPLLSTISPVNGATDIPTGTVVTATFNEAIDPATVTGTTFQLRDAGNNLVPATVSTNSGQITLDPTSLLAGSTVYTATITGGATGVKDLAGNALANSFSWSFTTVPVDNTPPTVTSVSPANGAAGVSIGTTVIANFSEAINSSTVTASTVQLRNPANTLINASLNVSGSQVTLTPTAALTASTVYTATISGGATGVKDLAGNALVSNYVWSFTTGAVDNIAPTVSVVSPANGSTGISTGTNVVATFSEGINASTVTTSTFQLRNSANTLITATVSTSGNQITLVPSAPLANSVVYTATITGGASGVKDLAGNALASNYSWSFTTVAASSTTYTIWPATATPAEPLNNDGQGIALGVKIRSSQNGFINGIRYYKGAGTTGTHTGHLWSSTGTLMGSVTFTGETASGWQQALFATPIAINANTTYVASIFSPSGHYAATDPYFTTAIVNGPIKALANGEDGPNGLYRYTSTNAFPNSSFNSSNYWIDVVFATGSTAVAPSVTTQPASQSRCAGANASFTSAASGTPSPTVQWQSSPTGTTWTNISGSTNATLTFAATTADNNKQYRAVWTNSAGTVNSNAATLTVDPIPVLSSSLTGTATSGSLFTYTPASSTSGTTFSWSRAAVTGISNAVANGTGTISETLVNTTSSAVNVTYLYTLTASGCTNTQNVVVTVSPGMVNASPSVTTQPLSQAKCAGESASFTSGASGTPAPTVQWQSSTTGTTWTNVTGATSPTLTFAVAIADNDKQYRAVWTNSAGTANSNVAVLTVNPIPALSSGLTLSTTSGSLFTYNPTSATPGTTFAWNRSFVTGISNAASNGTGSISESLVNTTSSPVNVTYVFTLNASGCSNTQNLVVTVNPDGSIVSPSIATQPVSQAKCPGQSVSFTSTANGTPTPTVQWQSSTNGTTWTNITGATNATLSFTVTGSDDNKQYRAVWSNNAGSVNSNAAILTVNPTPVLSSNLSATVTTGTAFTYTATSTIAGTTFAWSRAAVPGISNATANGTGNINETLVNTTASPVAVTYVYTLTVTATQCTNTQNVVVTVNPVSTINCVINGSIASNFNSTPIPAGRYIWFSSLFDRGSFSGISGTVTFNVTNSRITFTANNQLYTLNVPNSRIRFDAAITSATTQFVNGMWETVIPRSYSGYVFMGGLAYPVQSNLPGNISNVRWTATISIDKTNVSLTWRWAAAVYTNFAAESLLAIKAKNGSTQSPYPNNDNAGTPENFKSYVVSGAKGTGGTNYTGSYSSLSTATCSTTPGQRQAEEPLITRQFMPKKITSLPVDRLNSEELSVSALPNPSSNIFNIIIKGDSKSYVGVKVTDMFGRVVEHYQKVSANTILQIGQRLSGGSYFVEVTQTDKRRFLKIIKSN